MRDRSLFDALWDLIASAIAAAIAEWEGDRADGLMLRAQSLEGEKI